jgi:cell division transport system permease protein
MRAQPLAFALSTLVIAVAILLPLTLYIVFANVIAATQRLNTEPNLNVFMKLSASDADVKALETRLKSDANAASVLFVPRESALADMKKRANLGDLVAGLSANPLPHAFTVRLKSTDAAAIDTMRRAVAELPQVDQVTVDFEWAKKLTRFARFAERVVVLLALVLALAVVFVIGNTIRLQMLTQKDEILVARLIGATRRFVWRPFLYFGFLQGALAGLTAVALLAFITNWFGREIRGLTESYGSFTLAGFASPEAFAVVVAAALLGWLGAWVSVSLYWRHIEDS